MLQSLALAIVDVETTGVSITGDRIIEIAVQRVERGAVTRTFESLVDPGQRLDPFIERLTGIRQRDLAGAPTFRAIQEEVAALLEGCVFVAHNAGFDYGLIQHEFIRVGKSFESPRLCSVRLSRRLYPRFKRHGLDELIKRFELPCANRHRALGDAEAVWAFLQRAYQDRGPARFSSAVTALLRSPALPPQLPAGELARTPEGPGAYVLYDRQGRALYVGSSRHVRSRVRAHFLENELEGLAKRLHAQTARIESHPAFGELGAQLLALQLAARLAPAHTRRLRGRPGPSAPWPYQGARLVEEADADRTEGHVFVVNGWRLVQWLRYDESGEQPVACGSLAQPDVTHALQDHHTRYPHRWRRAEAPLPAA